MASAVATPLERQFGRIAGVTQMTSSSGLGNTGITLQFDLNRDINAARSQLPADIPSQPNYRKVNPADAPILMLSLTSENIPVISSTPTLAKSSSRGTTITPAISMAPGLMVIR